MHISEKQVKEMAIALKDEIKAYIHAHEKEYAEFLANEKRMILQSDVIPVKRSMKGKIT